MPLYLFIGSIILEFVCFQVLGFGAFAEYWLYDIAIILFVCMIVFIIPNYTTQYVISTIILFVQIVLIYANYTLYYIYGGELFTFDMLKLFKEAADASNSSFFNFSLIIQLVLIGVAIFFTGFWILKKCKKHKINIKKHYALVLAAFFACVQVGALGTVVGYTETINAAAETSSSYTSSDSFLLNTSFLKEASYKKFGTFGFYLNLLLNNNYSYSSTTEYSAIEYFNSGETYTEDNSSVFGVDSGNNVILIMMESLEWFAFGNGSYDASLQNLSSELTPNIYYLIYGEEDDDSDDSFIASNFFAKSKTNISEGYGIIGNYPVGQSLSDIAGEDYDCSLNAFGYALPSVLSSLGYNSTYVHSHDISYYSRSETHYNIGFDTVIGKNDLLDDDGNLIYTDDDLNFHHWASEADIIEYAIDYIVPESVLDGENFFTYYLTVSTHGGYSNNENNADQVRYKAYVMYGADNCLIDDDGNYYLNPEKLEEVNDVSELYTEWYANVLENYGDDEELCNYLVNYECGVVGLDVGIGVIIEKLIEYGIQDETTIILYSDHYAYYNSLSYEIKGQSSSDTDAMMEVYTIPFIISSPGLKKLNAETGNSYTYSDLFCSAYDIIPTILDLLGIEFNQNFYLGTSIFNSNYYISDEEKITSDYFYAVEIDGVTYYAPIKVYYSNVGGLYSEYIYTYDLENYTSIYSATISDEDFEKLVEEFNNVLTKVYYLSVLNNNALFTQISNNKFIKT